jgi:membrane-associated phospholipid phosphatase
MRRLLPLLLGIAVVGAAGRTAKADTSEPAPRRDKKRVIHAVVIGGFGAVYLLSEFAVKDKLAAEECAWCDPPGVDEATRDALRWNHTRRADILSTVTGYALPPFATMGLLVASTWGEGDKRRWFDDVAPVLEATIAVGIVNQLAKFIVARARPEVAFAEPGREASIDDHTSFFSGHTMAVFAQTVAAGTIARRRGYALEPAIWATGLTLGATTAYLRIAADKHYLSDVLAGAAIGSAFGYLVPRIFHTHVLGPDTSIVPTANGVAIAGTF